MKAAWRWLRRIVVLQALAAIGGYVTFAFVAPHASPRIEWLAGAAAALAVFAAGFAFFARGPARATLATELGGAASAAVFAFWMLWDPEPATPFAPLGPELSAAAEPARALFLQGCRGGACENWKNVFTSGSGLDRASPGDFDLYGRRVLDHVDEIERAWEELAPARAWLEAMNELPEFSDFVTAVDSPILSFTKLRLLASAYAHQSALRALHGDGDAALAALAPLAQFAGRARRQGRALVTVMTGTTFEKMAVDHARFVLAHSHPSEAARRAFAAVLDDGIADGRDVARCLRLEADISGAAVLAAFAGDDGALPPGPNPFSRWLGNQTGRLIARAQFRPNSFQRELREHHSALANCAERGDVAGLRAIEERFDAEIDRGVHIKNRLGFQARAMLTPACVKLTENVFRQNEARRALAATLRASDSEA